MVLKSTEHFGKQFLFYACYKDRIFSNRFELKSKLENSSINFIFYIVSGQKRETPPKFRLQLPTYAKKMAFTLVDQKSQINRILTLPTYIATSWKIGRANNFKGLIVLYNGSKFDECTYTYLQENRFIHFQEKNIKKFRKSE